MLRVEVFKINGLSRTFIGHRPRPIVTVNMVVEALSDICDIANMPAQPSKALGWCAYACAADDLRGQFNVPILYLVDCDNAQRVLEAERTSIGLLLLDSDSDIADVFAEARLKRYRNRILAVKGAMQSPCEVVSMIQNVFMNLAAWGNAMDQVIEYNGTFQELLDCSEGILMSHVHITDETFELVAHTRNFPPVGKLTEDLVRKGFYDATAIAQARKEGLFEDWTIGSGVKVYEPTELVPCPSASFVLNMVKEYCGHMVMLCPDQEITPALKDIFSVLAMYVDKLNSRSRNSGRTDTSAGRLMEKLVKQSAADAGLVDAQASAMGIVQGKSYMLALIDPSDGDYSGQAGYLATLLRIEFPKSVIFFAEDNLLVLMPCGDKADIPNLIGKFCAEHDSFAYLSDNFKKLSHSYYAYSQLLIVRDHHDEIASVVKPKVENDGLPVMTFTDAFCFYASDPNRDKDLSYRLMGRLVVDDIYERDCSEGTNDLMVLFWYLFYERRATPAAKRLHMHRNNVIYRIEAIQKRYKVDLGDFAVRQRVLESFRLRAADSQLFRDMFS